LSPLSKYVSACGTVPRLLANHRAIPPGIDLGDHYDDIDMDAFFAPSPAAWWGKKLAATVLTIALALAFILPGVLLTASLTDGVQSIATLATDLTTLKLPDLPSWVTGLLIVGDRVASVWQNVRTDMGATREKLQPHIITATGWLLAEGAKLGLTLLEFLLAVVFSGILYVTGENR
jgi:predicted PurR-regulated permease PerM